MPSFQDPTRQSYFLIEWYTQSHYPNSTREQMDVACLETNLDLVSRRTNLRAEYILLRPDHLQGYYSFELCLPVINIPITNNHEIVKYCKHDITPRASILLYMIIYVPIVHEAATSEHEDYFIFRR